MTPSALALLAAAVAVVAAPVEARGARFALVIGANEGTPDEPVLRYAVRDADRVATALSELGGFSKDSILRLEQPTAAEVMAAIESLAVRAAQAKTELVVVHYSGHGGRLSAHLGTTRLPWGALRDAVSAIPAGTQLLVVDACHSGNITAVKGLAWEEESPSPEDNWSEGLVVLSSAAAGEAAYESAALEGSLFTSHFVAGLRGAADRNRDDLVDLFEAFDYARSRTLDASSSQRTGQHATFEFSLKGRRPVAISSLTANRAVGRFLLSAPGSYVFRAFDATGRVVLEAGVRPDETRVVALPPGHYFVQRKQPRLFLEGNASLEAGKTVDLRSLELRRIRYAQLARKGEETGVAFSVNILGSAEDAGSSGISPWFGAALSFGFELTHLTVDAELAYRRTGVERQGGRLGTNAFDLMAGLRYSFDLQLVSLSFGARAGLVVYHQGKDTTLGVAESRVGSGPRFSMVARAEWQLPGRWFVATEVHAAVTRFAVESPRLNEWPITAGGRAGIGIYF